MPPKVKKPEHIDTVRDLIHTLGGNKAVADRLGLSRCAPQNWNANGSIPAQHWISLLAMLQADGVEITPRVRDLLHLPAGFDA